MTSLYIYSAGSSPAWGMCITAHLIFFFFPGLDTVTSSVPYIFVLDFRFFKIEINYISIFWSHVIIDFQPPLSTVIIWTPNELCLLAKLVNFHMLNTNELFLFAKFGEFSPCQVALYIELFYIVSTQQLLRLILTLLWNCYLLI